jgi:hypothetical protein
MLAINWTAIFVFIAFISLGLVVIKCLSALGKEPGTKIKPEIDPWEEHYTKDLN